MSETFKYLMKKSETMLQATDVDKFIREVEKCRFKDKLHFKMTSTGSSDVFEVEGEFIEESPGQIIWFLGLPFNARTGEVAIAPYKSNSYLCFYNFYDVMRETYNCKATREDIAEIIEKYKAGVIELDVAFDEMMHRSSADSLAEKEDDFNADFSYTKNALNVLDNKGSSLSDTGIDVTLNQTEERTGKVIAADFLRMHCKVWRVMAGARVGGLYEVNPASFTEEVNKFPERELLLSAVAPMTNFAGYATGESVALLEELQEVDSSRRTDAEYERKLRVIYFLSGNGPSEIIVHASAKELQVTAQALNILDMMSEAGEDAQKAVMSAFTRSDNYPEFAQYFLKGVESLGINQTLMTKNQWEEMQKILPTLGSGIQTAGTQGNVYVDNMFTTAAGSLSFPAKDRWMPKDGDKVMGTIDFMQISRHLSKILINLVK
jgi:hypothetical protein